MSKSFDVAVIGASGTVGETIVQLLDERKFPVATLHVLAGNSSAGQSVAFRGKNLRVRELAGFDFAQVQLVFFAAGAAVTSEFALKAHAAGCSVIELSGALSLDQAPRLVPEANADILATLKPPFLLSSPAPVAVALGLVLASLKPLLTLQKITLTAALAVSSRGRDGIAELARQTAELLNMRPLEPKLFDRQMAFNLLAQVDEPDDAGHGALERRVAEELRQVLQMSELKVAVTCVQAPVFFGDSLSVSLQSSRAVDIAQVGQLLDKQPGVERVEEGDYPTVVGDAVGQDEVYVGRLRQGLDDPTELNLWIASDNVRKGSALNAVQIGELLIKHYL